MRTPGAVVALAQGVRSSNRRGLKVWGCFMGVFFFRGCPRCRRIEANHPYSAAGASFASLWLLHPSGGTGATGFRLQATGYREVISSFETAHPAATTRRTSRSEICCGGNRTQITRRNAHAERKIQNTKPALRRDTHLQVSFPADPNPIVHGAREILGPHLAASPFDRDAASVTAHADADVKICGIKHLFEELDQHRCAHLIERRRPGNALRDSLTYNQWRAHTHTQKTHTAVFVAW